jgi:hypothetical protein
VKQPSLQGERKAAQPTNAVRNGAGSQGNNPHPEAPRLLEQQPFPEHGDHRHIVATLAQPVRQEDHALLGSTEVEGVDDQKNHGVVLVGGHAALASVGIDAVNARPMFRAEG